VPQRGAAPTFNGDEGSTALTTLVAAAAVGVFARTDGQLTYLRGRPLYRPTVWTWRAFLVVMLVVFGISVVGAGAFGLSLFCLAMALVPIMLAMTYLVTRDVERVVSTDHQRGFQLRSAIQTAIVVDAALFWRR
jgi:hypothetical protein